MSQMQQTYKEKALCVITDVRDLCEVFSGEFVFSEKTKKATVSLHISLKTEVAASQAQVKHISAEIQALKDVISKTKAKV